MEEQLLSSAAPRALCSHSFQGACNIWPPELLPVCFGRTRDCSTAAGEAWLAKKIIIMPYPEHISRETERFFHLFLCHQ